MAAVDSSVTWLGHASVLVRMAGVTLLTDPALRPRLGHLRRVGAGPAPGDPGQVDAVLLSHLHHDHVDLPSLRLLRRDTHVLAPSGSANWLRARGLHWAEELRIGESTRVGDVLVTAVPAEHDGRRWPKGPHAEAIGWLVSGPDGRTVYFAGDTDLHPAMHDLGAIACALLPVWGWGPNLGPGHLDPERAAEAVVRIRPELAVPIHWGTFLPAGLRRVWRPAARLLDEPPRDFAGHVRRLDPAAQVVVPEAGRPIPLPAPTRAQS